MDGTVIRILGRERVTVITFTLDTTRIFQMLDVVLFGALGKYATGLSTLDEEHSAAAFMIKIEPDFKQATVKINI
jgi:hypothetical protein